MLYKRVIFGEAEGANALNALTAAQINFHKSFWWLLTGALVAGKPRRVSLGVQSDRRFMAPSGVWKPSA